MLLIITVFIWQINVMLCYVKENVHVLVNQFYGNFHSKTPSGRKIKCVFRDVK